jgi:hypothetical protein
MMISYLELVKSEATVLFSHGCHHEETMSGIRAIQGYLALWMDTGRGVKTLRGNCTQELGDILLIVTASANAPDSPKSWLAGLLSGTTFTDCRFSRASRSSREESWVDLESAFTLRTVLRDRTCSIDSIRLLDRSIVRAINFNVVLLRMMGRETFAFRSEQDCLIVNAACQYQREM